MLNIKVLEKPWARVRRLVVLLTCDHCAVYPPIENCFRKACESASSSTSGRPNSGKHLRAWHAVVESCFSFTVALRATSEAAPTLFFLSELPPLNHEELGHKPDFIAALDGEQHEFVCSLGSFIACLAMSLPTMLRPSARRRSARSVIAAVTRGGSSNRMAAEDVNTIPPDTEIHEQMTMTNGYGKVCTTTTTVRPLWTIT